MYDHRKRFRSTVATEYMMIIEKQTQKKIQQIQMNIKTDQFLMTAQKMVFYTIKENFINRTL